MSVINSQEIKRLCGLYGLRPSKQYGQNFLLAAEPIKKILAAAELTKNDTVIEIGPGFGVLTLALAPLVKKVLAFEIEKKLQPYWEEKVKEYPNVEMVWGDFISNWKREKGKEKRAVFKIDQTNIQPFLISHFSFQSGYKVLANLPYNITSQVIRLFLESDHKPERLVLMVQKEVAERICARPGEMSLLSVAVQYYGEPRIVAHVPRGNFWPVPKVDSAIVRLETQKTRKHENTKTHLTDQQFFRVVKAGFAHKRKQLWRNLASGLGIEVGRVKEMLKEVVGDEKVRAEELSIDGWRRLSEVLRAGPKALLTRDL